jgi:hypothetical protein
LLFFAGAINSWSAPCTAGTLDTYIALGSTGCTVGQYLYANFGFSVLTDSGGAVAVPASGVTVTPATAGASFGLSYSSPGFVVAAGQKIEYLLTYDTDDPPIIHGHSLDMATDPPVFPGIASITSEQCLGYDFVRNTCMGPTASETVFSNGITSTLMAEADFAGVSLAGDRTTITLDASAGGAAEFLSLTDSSLTPEPGTAVPALLGIGGVLWFRLRRLRFTFKAH